MLPKGLGNIANLGGVLRSAMDLKGKVEQLKESLANERIEAAAGGGMVTVTMTGKMEVLSIEIDPEVIDKDDTEMLATLIQAAMNEAIRKAQDLVKSKMTEITGGLDIPGITS